MAWDRLTAVLSRHDALAVAVSGGVDSMTLAHAAHVHRRDGVEMFHAVSAAVPTAATERVRAHADLHGWDLRVIDAGELADPDYVANPVDRCFHCKRNLYGEIAAITTATIASGTNVDDLDDYRPGLQAAADADVVHPFVEAGIDKAAIRALARDLDLDHLAELPAAPCLSSRVETGIDIVPAWLTAIDDIETILRAELPGDTVRCRVRADRIVIEIDGDVRAGLDRAAIDRVTTAARDRWAAEGVHRPVAIEPYRRGSAFLTVRTT